ncbi:hypothetical protein OF83DRAFT_1121031 [Amylostereum chailletii]|nr:hypothetical protein OF83DRAFT_1121031 [Amylostereum chailletii]
MSGPSKQEHPYRRRRVAIDGVILALRAAKESSVLLPPLQAAVGGILVVIDTIKVKYSNDDDIAMLLQYVDKLHGMIKLVTSDTNTHPGEFQRRVQSFREYVICV